jgi:hypothetical protein
VDGQSSATRTQRSECVRVSGVIENRQAIVTVSDEKGVLIVRQAVDIGHFMVEEVVRLKRIALIPSVTMAEEEVRLKRIALIPSVTLVCKTASRSGTVDREDDGSRVALSDNKVHRD